LSQIKYVWEKVALHEQKVINFKISDILITKNDGGINVIPISKINKLLN
jgi:hypothetical protein